MKTKAIKAAGHTIGLIIEDADWTTRHIADGESILTLLVDENDLPGLVHTLTDGIQAPAKEQ